jgi:hypothetical protein
MVLMFVWFVVGGRKPWRKCADVRMLRSLFWVKPTVILNGSQFCKCQYVCKFALEWS